MSVRVVYALLDEHYNILDRWLTDSYFLLYKNGLYAS